MLLKDLSFIFIIHYQILDLAANSRVLMIMQVFLGQNVELHIFEKKKKKITNEIFNYVLILHVICKMPVSEKQRNISDFREFVVFTKLKKMAFLEN